MEAIEEPRTKKPQKSRSNVKTLLIVFYLHQEFVPLNQRVNENFYFQMSQGSCDLSLTGFGIIFHHDIMLFLSQSSITVIEHTPYSPNLAPFAFFFSQNEK